METIRILQDTYEKLYVITPLLAELLESEMPKTSPHWKQDCDRILGQEDFCKKQWSYFHELDSFYLLKLLKSKWDELADKSDTDFFTNENKRLFISNNGDSIFSIRNEIAHPEQWDYELDLYDRWNTSLAQAAKELGFNLTELLRQYHEPERQRILKIINDAVIEPALGCAELPAEIRRSVENTQNRLKLQTTAAGIIAFFTDALHSNTGKYICETFHAHKLKAFEDIEDVVRNAYFGKQ